jgi:hypothetical protein|tara:strand:- start:122 stop:346 length:225 start_codon:yes stop_codon:yes gene_type:complete
MTQQPRIQLAPRTLAFTGSGIDKLTTLVEYVMDAEKTSFDEWLADGGLPENHIYHNAFTLHTFLTEEPQDDRDD